jgi:hypothetical protein
MVSIREHFLDVGKIMEKQNTPRPWVVFTIAAEVVMLFIH